MQTKTLTIMFVDLVEYTKKASSTTRDKFIEHLDTYKSIAKPIFPKYHGHIVKEIGDAYMVSFESPTNAVLCGIYLQNSIAKHNQDMPKENKLHVKVAINTGEVHLKEGDVYGDAVNIASRLEKLTKPDRIYFTESVFLSMNKNEVSVGFVGAEKFKGIPHKINIYTVLGKYELILKKLRKKQKRFTRTLSLVLTVLLMFVLLGVIIGLIVFLALNQGTLF